METSKKSVLSTFFATVLFSYLTVLSVGKPFCWAIALITVSMLYLTKIELDVWYEKFQEKNKKKLA